jgi:hypothetical protein
LSKKKMAGTPIYASINAHLANGGNPYWWVIMIFRMHQKRWFRIFNVCFDLTSKRVSSLAIHQKQEYWRLLRDIVIENEYSFISSLQRPSSWV